MNHSSTNNNDNNEVDGLNEQAEEMLQAETINTYVYFFNNFYKNNHNLLKSFNICLKSSNTRL